MIRLYYIICKNDKVLRLKSFYLFKNEKILRLRFFNIFLFIIDFILAIFIKTKNKVYDIVENHYLSVITNIKEKFNIKNNIIILKCFH